MNNATIGYLALIRLPKLSIPYSSIEQLALDARFDEHYTPQQSSKRHAWQKATNLGNKGLKVNPPQNKLNEVFAKYGVEPRVRLHTEIVDNSYPIERRHIVRTVTIPSSEEIGQDKRSLADIQLSQKTVCIMSFDCSV